VLRQEKPSRPTLFELFMNAPLYARLAGNVDTLSWPAELVPHLTGIYGFRGGGYDYASFLVPGFGFPAGEVNHLQTRSLNEGAVIKDRQTLESYAWPDPDAADHPILERIAPYVPEGMKFLVLGPGGVLENVISLVGYESLCLMLMDDVELVGKIFDSVGSRLLRYYTNVLPYDVVGGVFGNDDWGFKSQTMLSPEGMRQFVFPWHKKIVTAAHNAGKVAVLHSCGCLKLVMDDVIDDMGYDGKHSYEDAIEPVEQAYDLYHERIGVMGGMDVDFVCRSTPDAVFARSSAMLEKSLETGSYALGTGNSVPEYVPQENYLAMIGAAIQYRQ
jgi:uroporphyrinogen decarboxylase